MCNFKTYASGYHIGHLFIERSLASGAQDNEVRLWHADSGTCHHVLKEHGGRIKSVAFSPNGRFVASGSHDHTVRIWDPQTGGLLATLRDHKDHVSKIIFSADGRTLASTSYDVTVKLWDLSAPRLLWRTTKADK